MKDIVTYQGMDFEPFISREAIDGRVTEIATQINADYAGRRPLIICVLTGAFPFASDLFMQLDIDAEITFIRLKSYEGMSSTGKVKEILGLKEDVAGRDVIVVEDIVDTGFTIQRTLEQIKAKNPASLKVATLLFKPESLKVDFAPDYVGFSIPQKFIIGFGLDLDGLARNLGQIYVLKEDK